MNKDGPYMRRGNASLQRLLFLASLAASICVTVRAEDERKQKATDAVKLISSDDSNWQQSGNWQVRDGLITCEQDGESIDYQPALPGKFDLRFEWKATREVQQSVAKPPEGSVALAYRAIPITTIVGGKSSLNWSGDFGFTFQLGSGSIALVAQRIAPADMLPNSSAINIAPTKQTGRATSQWNRGRVAASDSMVQFWINDERVVEIDFKKQSSDKESKSLFLLAQKLTNEGLHLELKDSAGGLQFRNIQLEKQ
jgi:hypothetical protein